MSSKSVILIHPADKNILSLELMFKERGDESKTFIQWDDVQDSDIISADIIVLDTSFLENIPLQYSELLSKKPIIFTDTNNLDRSKPFKFLDNCINGVIKPDYNRFQIENAIVNCSNINLSEVIEKPNKKRGAKLSLRFKISFPYLVLTIALGFFGAFILTRIVFDTIEDRFSNQLLEAGKINHEWMVDKESTMLETVRYIANIEGMNEILLQKDSLSLGEYLFPIALNEELDTIRILDKDGFQIIGMEHIKGGNIEEYEFYNNAIDYSDIDVVSKIKNQYSDDLGDKFAGFFNITNEDFFIIGGPILNDQRDLEGIVLVGEYIDSIVEDMRLSTLTQVSFYAMDGKVISSSFMNPTPLLMNMVANVLNDKNDKSYVRDLDAYEISYGEILTPLILRGRETVGVLGNALAKNFFLYSTFVTQIQIVVFFLLAIVLVLVIGMFISKIVSDPLHQLIKASKQVAEGDYSVSVNSFTGDEIGTLATTFNTMVSSVQNSKTEIIDAYDKSLDGWSRALELRDKETDYHCHRVAEMAVKIAKTIGFPEAKMQNLHRGSLLHDIGKMGIPDNILLKPGSLKDREWTIMRKHPIFAMDLLKDIPFLHDSFEIPYCHHEKWDGTGYPNHLKGEEIPLSARIFAIVDVWDAMSSDRPYRKAMDNSTVLQYITKEKGHHFDPAVVDAFLKIIEHETD